ncbi:MAG: hypothetical protein EAX95_12620 [Candidatus Thorarchaeota archaeon]|nr:hypothetical protein [Candidatus Thorarchaeota archaeon]
MTKTQPTILEDEGMLVLGVFIIAFFTIMFWSEVSFAVQTVAVFLSAVYMFFGGIGLYYFSNRLYYYTRFSTFELAASLWLLFLFFPTILEAIFPTSTSGLVFLDIALLLASIVKAVVKAAFFIYGFGYILFAYFAAFLRSSLLDSRERDSPSGYLMTLYFFILGAMTVVTTIQISVGIWFPNWLPSVNGVNILRFVWLVLSIAGLMYKESSSQADKDPLEIVHSMSPMHRGMIAIGSLLLVPPGILVVFNPAIVFYIVYPGLWLFAAMGIAGILLVTYPIFMWMESPD